MYEFHDIEERSPIRLGRRAFTAGALALAAVILIGIVLVLLFLIFRTPDGLPKKPVDVVVTIVVPPPPPPPKETPPPEQKMIEAPKPTDAPDTPKPEDKPLPPAPDEAKDDSPPPAPLGLDAKPEGPADAFGLVGRPGGRGLLGGGGGGSAEGRFTKLMIDELREALGKDSKIRTAVAQVQLRYWLDQAGRVTKLVLQQSTGDPEMDTAIRTLLSSFAFSQPPPKSIPMPINSKVTLQRAS